MSSAERLQKLEFARSMVKVLEEHLASGAGVFMVQMDGTMVQFQRSEAVKELEHWRKQVTRYSRTKSRFSTFNLGNSHE
jgi:predicted HAD superfamily phosphohydrolase YqeG